MPPKKTAKKSTAKKSTKKKATKKHPAKVCKEEEGCPFCEF